MTVAEMPEDGFSQESQLDIVQLAAERRMAPSDLFWFVKTIVRRETEPPAPLREAAEAIADKLLNECRERKWEDGFYAEPEVRDEWFEIVMAELQLLKSGQHPSSS
ncbi:hypothetical protein [Bradyrhizobium lupini]|uniref:hypothetical protein n=1 Tax=Rhizobium lupini TaxID=136996 RepID=UPI0034C5E09B